MPGFVVTALLMLLAIGAGESSALATNGTWTNTFGGGLWSASTNWSGGAVATGTDGIANFSTLNITSDETVHLDSARTIGGLLFGDTTPSNNWILDNNGDAADILTLSVLSGSPSITVNNDMATINVVLAGTQGLTKRGAGTLVLNESNTFSGGVAVQQGALLIVRINNVGADGTLGNNTSVALGASGQTGTFEFSGSTASSNMPFALATGGTGAFQVDTAATNLTLSGAISGSGALTKSGAGKLTLSGNNTFSGGVSVSVGTLILANPNALGDTAGGTSVASGAILDLGGQAIGAEALTIAAAGSGNGALVTSSASGASLAGTVTVFGHFAVGGSGDITLSGSVNGANNVLTKLGNNTLTLSGTTDNNSLAVTVTGGTVVLAKASSHAPNDVHAIGQAVLTVSGGTAQLGGTGGDQIFDLGSVTVTSGAFDTNGRSETFATLKLQGTGVGNAGALINTAAGTSTITPTGGTTLTANATIGVTQASGSLTLNNAITGAFALTETGLGTLVLGGNNTFSGGLTIQQGTLQVATINNAGTSGPLGNNTSVVLDTGAQSAALDYTGGTAASTMPFTVTPSAGANVPGVLQIDNSLTNLTLSGVIGGSGGFAKTGAGMLTLAGNNTFTGLVTVNSGTLRVGSASALNSNVGIEFGGSSGTLSLAGNSLSIGDLNGGTLSTVQNSSDTGAILTVNVNAPNSDLFGGVLQDGGAGALSLTKAGSGTLTLSGNNTYSGPTNVTGGTLVLGNANALGSTAAGIAVVSGATLDLGGQAIGAKPLTIAGTGVGGLGALINNSNSAASFAGAIDENSSNSFNVGGVGDITLSGILFNDDPETTGTITLTKVGGNTLTLSGLGRNQGLTLTVNSGTVVLAKRSDSFTHAVGNGNDLAVNGGIVQLGGTGGDQIGDGVDVTVFTGAAFDTNGLSETFRRLFLEGTGIAGSGALVNSAAGASVLSLNEVGLSGNVSIGVTQSAGSLTPGFIVEGGFGFALTKVGAGTLVLTDNNSFSGGLTVANGTLQVPGINDAGANGPLGNNTSVALGTAGQSGPGQPIGTLEYTGGTASSTMPFTIAASNGAFQIDNAATNLTLSGAIGGSGEFIKNGPGTLTLAGNNTFSGLVIINAGILQAGSAGAINSNMGVSFGGSSGAFNLAGNNVTVMALSAGGPPNNAILTQNGGATLATLTIKLPGVTSALYEGVLQDGGPGPLALVISGGGTEFIAGSSNSFTGGLTVQQGTLKILTINDVSTFGSLGNNTSVTLGSSGQTGMLEFAGNKPIPSSDMPFTLATGGTGAFQVDNATTNLTLFGSISGSGGLIKSGPGRLTLGGVNTYSGGTNVTNGTLNTTPTGSLGAGPLTISAADGITSAVNLGNNQTVSSLSGTIAGIGSATLSIGSGVTLTDDQSSGNTVFLGRLMNSGTFAKSGTNSLEMNGAPTLNANSVLQVNGGRLRFNINSGAATISTGVTATVASGATLELAGSVSALASGANRVNISNNSNSTGLLVSGTHQQVGNIGGSGTMQVIAGGDLTANRIIQGALVIGGTVGSPAIVTIDASDSSGNSLVATLSHDGGLGSAAFETSVLSSRSVAIGDLSFPSAPGGEFADAGPILSREAGRESNASSVPEPSAVLLLGLGMAVILLMVPRQNASLATPILHVTGKSFPISQCPSVSFPRRGCRKSWHRRWVAKLRSRL